MTALLAFCNDIDFADWATYLAAHHELREEFGLCVEDSFWMFDPAGSEMALFRGSLEEKGPRHDELLEEIRAGRLAILHGGGAFDELTTTMRPTRGLLAEGLAYLREHAAVPRVWTNHGDVGNIQNIGWPGASYQQGDDPASETFVLDLLLQHGVRYFWTDRHATNNFVLRPVVSPVGAEEPTSVRREPTRAGFTIHGFYRYRGALRKAPDAQTLGQQLTDEHLARLADESGATVIYQHWCVHRDESGRPFTARGTIFPEDSRRGLRRLAELRDAGRIQILSTETLLDQVTGAAPALRDALRPVTVTHDSDRHPLPLAQVA